MNKIRSKKEKKEEESSEANACPYMSGGESPDGDAIWSGYASNFGVGADTTNY